MDPIIAQIMKLQSLRPSPELPALPDSPPKTAKEEAELREACKAFEAIFIKQMLDSMRKTVDRSDSLLGGGYSEEIYQDMLYDEYSKLMTNTGSFGIADLIYGQLSGTPLTTRKSAYE